MPSPRGHADRRTPPTALDRLGGWWGIVGTGLPHVVFAVLTKVTTLPVTATAAFAVARIVLGVPLTAVVTLVVFWAFRRTTHRLVTPVRVAARSS
jgi:hypothetical protein